MSGDSVRLPNGSITTVNRARARGWIDADGNLTPLAPQPTRVQAEREKAARARDWKRRQGLPLPEEDSAEEKAALAGKPAKRVKPLKPQNVTPEGEPVTDANLLAEIAERTAAIERAEKAARS